jgi:hypothetical protein
MLNYALPQKVAAAKARIGEVEMQWVMRGKSVECVKFAKLIQWNNVFDIWPHIE